MHELIGSLKTIEAAAAHVTMKDKENMFMLPGSAVEKLSTALSDGLIAKDAARWRASVMLRRIATQSILIVHSFSAASQKRAPNLVCINAIAADNAAVEPRSVKVNVAILWSRI